MDAANTETSGEKGGAGRREPSEVELRYWLANEDWYPSTYTRQWLERTPPDAAADVLARIAEDADLETRSLGAVLGLLLGVAGFSMANGVNGKRQDDRKSGIRAALLLARLGDPRSIPPLARVFETHWLTQSNYQPLIEAALKQVLTAGTLSHSDLKPSIGDLRTLARRLWEEGRGRRDLTDGTTEALLAAQPQLAASDQEADAELLRRIAGSRATMPNRRLIREAASALLNGPPATANAR